MKLFTLDIEGVTEQCWAIGDNEAIQQAMERYVGMNVDIKILRVEEFF